MAIVREGTESLVDAYLAKPIAPAICMVDKIYPHQKAWNMGAGDRKFNVVDIHLRDIREPPNDENDIKIYKRALVLQRYHGNACGTPWTPRVGDLVLVLYLHDNLPIILGTLPNIFQEPVCRPNSNEDSIYDMVCKICKWERPKRTKENEYNWTEHPFPSHPPVCMKYFDDTRDCVLVHTCPHGYKGHDEVCENCNTVDYIDAGTYLKVLSGNTNSKIDPNWRTKYHHITGSIVYFDYDGTIHIENKVQESPKGHIIFYPTGTIEMHSDHDENSGASVTVYAPEDPSTIAADMLHRDTGAHVRIYKSGVVEITAAHVHIYSNVTIHGHLTVSSCTHGPCSCG